ncbi:MAG: NHL repeat-containing protein [bacterium]
MKNIICFIIFCAFFIYHGKVISQFKNSNITCTYQTSWGEEGEGELQFKEPNAISASPDGNIYIADTGNQRIQKLNPLGEFVQEAGGFGWGGEEFDKPVSLCTRNGLDVYVADYNNHRIKRYDKDLNYLASIYTSEDVSSELKFSYPLDVTISDQGELFCLDGDNIRILKLNLNAEPQLSFGDYDAGIGRLYEPLKMCILQSSFIYVSDRGKQAIMVFDIYGNYLFQIGVGKLQAPSGVSLIDLQYLLVTDYDQKLVFIFTTRGRLITQIDRRNYTGNSFQKPMDVCFHNNRIFVLDKSACRIDVFNISFNTGHSEE